ncbi:hypothetical protein ACFL0V_04620 [Nanoarchaeota archaeon]
MNWKSLPSWLKGGIIGSGIFVALGIILTILFFGDCSDMGCVTSFYMMFSLPTLLLAIPFAPEFSSQGALSAGTARELFMLIAGFIAGAIQYFAIGAGIGKLVQKIRKK